MERGTVKWFDEEKGYGFIQSDTGGKEFFVHKTQIDGSIAQGQRVEFEIGEGQKGPMATHVSAVDESGE